MDAREKEIYRVTLIGTVTNAVLILMKFLAGVVGRSSAMLADAVQILHQIISQANAIKKVHSR